MAASEILHIDIGLRRAADLVRHTSNFACGTCLSRAARENSIGACKSRDLRQKGRGNAATVESKSPL